MASTAPPPLGSALFVPPCSRYGLSAKILACRDELEAQPAGLDRYRARIKPRTESISITKGNRLPRPKDVFVSPKYKDPWGSSPISNDSTIKQEQEDLHPVEQRDDDSHQVKVIEEEQDDFFHEQKQEEEFLHEQEQENDDKLIKLQQKNDDVHQVEPQLKSLSATERIADALRSIKVGVSNQVPVANSRLSNLMRVLGPLPAATVSTSSSNTGETPRFPWELESPPRILPDGVDEPRLRPFPPSLAEVVIPDAELRRLRTQMMGLKERVKLRKFEISNAVVRGLHERWKYTELIKIRCEGPPVQNMRRMHVQLEQRTGGLVIWRGGASLVIYRGKDYVAPRPMLPEERPQRQAKRTEKPLRDSSDEDELVDVMETKYDLQMDKLLDSLGPRYTSWSGARPVPVDGDKLPEVDHTYKAPYRHLPDGVLAKLSNAEMIDLRRVAKTVPPHFVLARSHGLQGLAHAMVKLWEKSEIAKILIKSNARTNVERMADELKRQTRGILIWRDAESLIFYRGKDFLPAAVAAVMEEREFSLRANEEEEDKARILPTGKMTVVCAKATTEEAEADARLQEWLNSEEQQRRRAEAAKSVRVVRARRIQTSLEQAWAKKAKVEAAIQKLERLVEHRHSTADREGITEEERYMLLKLGLKMRAALDLGRRGVFAGTVENMHLHWKYRDMVKVIYKGKDRLDIDKTAKMLEAESGGILVGIVPTFKGAALLYYRGKNYRRPDEMRPKTLLTKKKALELHTASQRRQSLSRHILILEQEIKSLGYMLEKMKDEGSDGTAVHYAMDEEEQRATKTCPKKTLTADELGPVVRAPPLTNKERLLLRKKALLMGKPNHFHVGKSGVAESLILAIRLHLARRALVKIGVKGCPRETPVQEIIKLIQDATGAAFVCVEKHKLIFYRGWPEGKEHPDYMVENFSEELLAAIREEESYTGPEFSSQAKELKEDLDGSSGSLGSSSDVEDDRGVESDGRT